MRVRVLGQLTVTDEDGIGLGADELPRRARQVLAVLAARHDRIQSKDALADAVWGGDLPGNHVAALEHYVSVVRRRLQPHGSAASWFIVTRSGGYLFDTGRAELDLAEVRARIRALDAAPAEDRLALQTEILTLAQELPFAEDQYAEWAEAARNEVQVAAVNALLELAAAAQPMDATRALRLAHEAIAMDPFLEPGYHAAMSAAVALGRTDDALRIFERCKRTLDEELSVSPSAELVQLQRSVLAGRRAQPLAPAAIPQPKRRPAPPGERFLGRTAHWKLLFSEQYAPAVVHVVGPNGAGKTAFLRELGRHAPDRVGVGHGTSSVGGLRLAWLRSALVDLHVAPEILAVVDNTEPERQLRRGQLEAIGTAFAGPDPVFLAVDDAGDLDAASVAELAWLSRNCPALRIVLAYCYPSEISRRPIAGLGTPVVLRLYPLTAEELSPLCDNSVLDRTGGIPALVAVADQPDEIALAVAMQVARLRTRWMPEPAWEMLRLCAALGPLRASDLAVLTDRPVTDVLVGIDRLVHAHLLSEEAEGLVRHRSALVRAAVAEQVSGASSRHLRDQLAAAASGELLTPVPRR
jgi:DNA-binding SARP family transcriptional activator